MIAGTEPIVIASLAREQGITGVHTHVHQLGEFGGMLFEVAAVQLLEHARGLLMQADSPRCADLFVQRLTEQGMREPIHDESS